MGFYVVKKEVETEKSLECWARRCTNHFTKKMRRMLYEEIDNVVWNGNENVISEWCKQNKVYDEITEAEIEEIWMKETPDEEENVRLNGKYVWETAKRVCDYINAHEDLIHITSFGEYRMVMKKVMNVIKEANNVERKRRQTARMKRSDETETRMQRAKALVADIKQGKARREDIVKRLEKIFGKGSGQEIETASTEEKIVERIVELSKREEQLEKLENMRRDAKKKQREDRR